MNKDYIKQLEDQNEELRQMLASAETRIAAEQADALSALMAENIALRAELGQVEDEDEEAWK